MEELVWGVPTANRTRKEEQFTVPVLTMTALLKDGASRKFSFNKAAVSALGLIGKESYIRVGFQGNSIFVMNAGVVEKDEAGNPLTEAPSNSFLLAGNNSFADKKVFEYIVKTRELSNQVENHLHLVTVECKNYFAVDVITSDNETIIEGMGISISETVEEVITVDEVISEIPGVTVNEEVEEVWETEATPAFEAPVVEKAIIKPVVKKATPVAKAEPKPTAVKFAIGSDTEDDGFSDTPVVNAPEVEDDGFGNPVANADEEVW